MKNNQSYDFSSLISYSQCLNLSDFFKINLPRIMTKFFQKQIPTNFLKLSFPFQCSHLNLIVTDFALQYYGGSRSLYGIDG